MGDGCGSEDVEEVFVIVVEGFCCVLWSGV